MKDTLLKAVKWASEIAADNFEKPKKVKDKKGTSLVSNVDLECNKTIIKIIKKKFPGHNILSEETGFEDNKSDYTWHIDPIDGTHNYVRKIPLYGISVALARHGQVIMGAVALPYFSHLYFAEKGKGAFLNGRKIHVSRKNKLHFYNIAIDFPSARRQYSLSFLNNIASHIVDVKQFGCAVYHGALLAEGKLDAYVIQKTNPWDIAAAFLIIGEAKGKVTNFEGRPWSLKDDRFVATNGLLHDDILECVRHIK